MAKNSKQCPVCGEMFNLQGISNHIKKHKRDDLEKEIPASHTQVVAFELEKEELQEKILNLKDQVNRAERIAEAYKNALLELVSLDRKF